MKFPIKLGQVRPGVIFEKYHQLFKVIRHHKDPNYGEYVICWDMVDNKEIELRPSNQVFIVSSKRKLTTSGKRWNDKYKQNKYSPKQRRSRTRK